MVRHKYIDHYQIPAFYLPFIVNGDSTGLSNEEKRMFQDWEQRIIKNNPECSHIHIVTPRDNERPYFTKNPDITNKECDVFKLGVYGYLKRWDM